MTFLQLENLSYTSMTLM